MKIEYRKHIFLTQNVVINGKKVNHGLVLKKEGSWVTSSDGTVLSNFPTVKPDKLWEKCCEFVDKGQAEYLYSHINSLEKGEIPNSCNGCPYQSFTGGYFGKKDHEWRMSCNANGVGYWDNKNTDEDVIKYHHKNKTKPKDCPILLV